MRAVVDNTNRDSRVVGVESECTAVDVVIVGTHRLEKDDWRLLPVEHLVAVKVCRAEHGFAHRLSGDIGVENGHQDRISHPAPAAQFDIVIIAHLRDGRELSDCLAVRADGRKHGIDDLLFLFSSHILILLTG